MDFKKELLEKYPFRLELHLHSNPASRCSRLTPEEIVEMYHKAGFSGITLTNHIDPGNLGIGEDEFCEKYFADYDAACKAAEKYGMYVYLGAEIRFTENSNDYLVYGVDEDMVRLCYRSIDGTVENFYKAAKTDRNLIVQAHPFRDHMEQNYTEHLDGIEVFNMAGHNARIAIAARFAAQNSGVVLGGNDVHYPHCDPIFATRLKKAPADCMELAAILKSGDYIFELGEAVILP